MLTKLMEDMVVCVYQKIPRIMKSLVNELDLDLDIFKFIDEENDKFVKKVPKGMRKEI